MAGDKGADAESATEWRHGGCGGQIDPDGNCRRCGLPVKTGAGATKPREDDHCPIQTDYGPHCACHASACCACGGDKTADREAQ